MLPSSVHRSTVFRRKASTMHNTPPTELTTQARAALTGRRYPPELLAQLDLLSDPALRASPWITLFQGRRLCRLHSRFAEATLLIDQALAAFRAQDDQQGELWAMAEWVVMRYHAADFDTGLVGIETLIERPMHPYLRAELLFGRFLCMIGLARVREAVQAGETALDLLDNHRRAVAPARWPHSDAAQYCGRLPLPGRDAPCRGCHRACGGAGARAPRYRRYAALVLLRAGAGLLASGHAGSGHRNARYGAAAG